MNLNKYGWDEHFENAFQMIDEKNLIPARIIADYGQAVRVCNR